MIAWFAKSTFHDTKQQFIEKGHTDCIMDNLEYFILIKVLFVIMVFFALDNVAQFFNQILRFERKVNKIL